MKYALILQTEFNHPNYWVCYGLANSMESLREHNICYDPSVKLMLSKVNHKGNPVEQFDLPSCASGSYAPFIVLELEGHLGLDRRFEL